MREFIIRIMNALTAVLFHHAERLARLASVEHFAKFLALVVSSVTAVMRSRVGEDVEIPPALVSQDPSKG